jgi:FkbM family methyltransferase
MAGDAVGIFIEPLLPSFNALRAQYEGYSALKFVNCAIDHAPGDRVMYVIGGDPATLPAWAYQVASFDRQILVNHGTVIPDIESRITSVTVPCRTLASVIEEYGAGALDLLHIDTEGYDYEILKMFPFKSFQPELVIFEHTHLKAEDLNAAQELLKGFGYGTARADVDIVATLLKRRS